MPTADLSNRAPTLTIRWDASVVGITGEELVQMLDRGTPRILVDGGRGHRPDMMESSIGIMPYMMQPDDHRIVAETLVKYLKNPGVHENPPVDSGPNADLSGTWDAHVRYNVGEGYQLWAISQSGTGLTGMQKGEFFSAALKGTVQGSHVMLHSNMVADGQEFPWTFTGVLKGTVLSGDVNMGEYGKAVFTATRA